MLPKFNIFITSVLLNHLLINILITNSNYLNQLDDENKIEW